MKQKIVVKAQIHCGKCRKKALKIAASADGVISVAIQGKDKDEIMIIGDSVDSAGLCTALRKKLGYANLISVEEVKDPKPEEKKPEEKKTEKSEEKKPEKEEKKAEGDKKKEEEKKQKEDGANKSESKASSIYHHYHPNYPPTNYCCPNYPPPQCHLYTTYYDDPNPNCTIM
ncbi:unnamed protein product [Amaranthus hypochondriacus]